MKKQMLATLCLIAALAAPTAASAACYADYKAKKDNPLKLHYGVARLPDNACASRKNAARALGPRLSAGGWQLLNVLSVFGPGGLKQREGSAGRYYLRY